MTTLEPLKDSVPLAPPPEQLVGGPYDPEMKEAGQLTSPTWELELFLSGAFVFAMFQLPGLIEQLFASLEPHATESIASVLFTGALYAKAIAFTLIATFLIHLIARAYWIALLGLQSVFPHGVRWSEMRVGPIARQVYQSQVPEMGRTIARLDNTCSVIFSVGLLIVFIFVYATFLVTIAAGLAYLIASTFHHGQGTRYYFYAVMALFVGVSVAGSVIDRRRGEKLAPDSRAYRVVHGIIQLAFRINLVRFSGPMVWTLATNIGRTKSVAFMLLAVIGLIFVAVADRLAQSDRLSVNGYDFFGASRAHMVQYRFYENQREAGKAYTRNPSIQSDIIRDPYVKLFIPYWPRRENAAIAATCPALKPLQDRGVQLGADPYLADSLVVPVLACIAKIHSVSLDGVARPDVEFSFYEQPSSGLKGVVAYIPVDSLPHGRHSIGVLAVPPPAVDPAGPPVKPDDWKRLTTIPFWR